MSENIVLNLEKMVPSEVRVKPGRCEMLLPNGDLPRIVALDNFVPVKRIIDLLPGWEKLEIIDQQTPDTPIEEGRYLVRATQAGNLLKGYCDGYADVG